MELETSAAEGIRLADHERKARYDAACKRLLSEKIFLAWIMKSCMEEYQACSVEEIAAHYIEGTPEISTAAVHPDQTNRPRIHGANTEDKTMTEGTVVYDIRFRALVPGSGDRIGLIINIEAQNVETCVYELVTRGVYYGSRMISAQYGTEFSRSEYQNLKKVYSVWLSFGAAREMQNTITKYELTEKNVIGSIQERKAAYDLLTVVIIRLGEKDDVAQNNILRLLNTLFSRNISTAEKKQRLQEDFNIPMVQTVEGRIDDMCNLGQSIEDRGIALGEKRTFEKVANAVMQNFHIPREELQRALDLSHQGLYDLSQNADNHDVRATEEFAFEQATKSIMQNLQVSREEARRLLNLPSEEQ